MDTGRARLRELGIVARNAQTVTLQRIERRGTCDWVIAPTVAVLLPIRQAAPQQHRLAQSQLAEEFG
jgi:hypothetical protein